MKLGRSVNVAYHYSNSKEDSEAVRSIAKQWYEGGTEVIFACGNKVELPVIEVAEMTNRRKSSATRQTKAGCLIQW